MPKTRKLAAKDVLSLLTASALIDIRATAYSGAHLVEIPGLDDMERVRMLADMFHNTPGVLTRGKPTVCQAHLESLWGGSPARRAWLEGAARYHRLDRADSVFQAWIEEPASR